MKAVAWMWMYTWNQGEEEKEDVMDADKTM